MRLTLLDILACPACRGALSLTGHVLDGTGDRIVEGRLRCKTCRCEYPIRGGIPRFVETHAADASFGFQWHAFRREQLDSEDGAGVSADRFWSETGWDAAALEGLRVVDVGCGAGRFLEIVARTGADVVGVDATVAIDAAALTVRGLDNVDLVQADVFALPFRAGAFDACYCIGVAQHTAHPVRALASLPRLLRAGGALAVTVYERKPWTMLHAKYLMRPLTRRMNKRLLLWAIRLTMPIVFPLTELLFRVPVAGRLFEFVCPIPNYVHVERLSWRQRYRVAVLDTFDRLAPPYDWPLTEAEVRAALAGIEDLRRLPNGGVNMAGRRHEGEPPLSFMSSAVSEGGAT